MNRFQDDVHRLLDANMNRAVEGIRVLEETARMLFDDSPLTVRLKDVRHELVQGVKKVDGLEARMMNARESVRDVLRDGETASEKNRRGIGEIVRANASRSQEAVRSLEEYVKVVYPGLSEYFKRIRFELYDLEKELFTRVRINETLGGKRLKVWVILNSLKGAGEKITDIVAASADLGAGSIVYRDRETGDREFICLAEHIISVCRNRDVSVFISGRVDAALYVCADGVCLENDDMTVGACRIVTGGACAVGSVVSGVFPELSIGEDNPDFYLLGPVDTMGEEGISPGHLSDFVRRARIPVIVSGGITSDNVESFFENGAAGIALEAEPERFDGWKRDLGRLSAIVESVKNV